MKINELISGFTIFTSREEEKVLEKMSEPLPLIAFEEREQTVIENLIRKGLVVKIGQSNPMVVKNEIN